MVDLQQECPFPDCRRAFEVPEAWHGHAIRCPACGRSLTALSPDNFRQREAERLRREIVAAAGRGGREAPDCESVDRGFVALLENVRSLWNVGSMFRTADGAGIGRLILTGITGRPPRREISKTALGADEVVAWEYQADPLVAAEALQAAGFRLLALETGEGSGSLEAAAADGRICLLVGHEVAGLSNRLLAIADDRLAIPMRGVKESLNVAVAFGIAAYALAGRRRRMRPTPEPAGEDRRRLS